MIKPATPPDEARPCGRRYRFTVRRLMVAVAIAGALLAALRWAFTGPKLSDRLVSYVVGHDTAYSAGYTEAAWGRIRLGMTGDEVETELGLPLRVWPNGAGGLVWMYSWSPADTHYWMRHVCFRAGRVESLNAEFYFD